MKSHTLVNDLLLLATAAIWGFAFVAQRVGMDHIGPFLFNGIRFSLGALVLLPLAFRWAPLAREQRGTVLRAGIVAGVVLFAAAGLQQIGLVYTTAGNAGFITGLYVVMVPLLGIVRKQSVGPLRWVAVVLAIAGLYLLSVQKGFSVNPGDLFVMGSAFFFALHVQVIDHVSRRHSALWFSLTQYIVVALISLVAGVLFEPFSFASIGNAAVPILYGGIGSISIAYTLQVVAQRRAAPSHAAILLSLEGTFAAIGGWLMLSEILTPRAIVGCALLLFGMILSQVAGLRRRPILDTPVPNTSRVTLPER